jgi:hypothetical protein
MFGCSWVAECRSNISEYNPTLSRLIPTAVSLLLHVTLPRALPAVSIPVTAENEGAPISYSSIAVARWLVENVGNGDPVTVEVD